MSLSNGIELFVSSIVFKPYISSIVSSALILAVWSSIESLKSMLLINVFVFYSHMFVAKIYVNSIDVINDAKKIATTIILRFTCKHH